MKGLPKEGRAISLKCRAALMRVCGSEGAMFSISTVERRAGACISRQCDINILTFVSFS